MSIINNIDKNFEKKYKKFSKYLDPKINYNIEFDKEKPNLLYIYNGKKNILKAEFQFIGLFKNRSSNWVWSNIISGVNKRLIKTTKIIKKSSHLFENMKNEEIQFYHQLLTNDSLYIDDDKYLNLITKIVLYLSNGLFILTPISNRNYSQYLLITKIITKE